MRCGIVEDEEPEPAREKLRATLEEHLRDPQRACLGRAAPGPPARPRRGRARRPGEPLLRLADPLRAPGRDGADDPRLRGRAVGRRRGCSTSSSTSSTGRAATRSSCLRSPAPSSPTSAPTWGAGKRSFTPLYLEPLSAPAMDELLTGLVPGLPDDLRRGSSSAPRGCRSTPWRQSGCCSTGAWSCGRERLPADRADRDARGARDAARPRRRTARRAARPRSGGSSRTGRCSARPSPSRGSARSPELTRRARAAAGVAPAQGGPLGAGGPPLSRARPVRLPAGHRQARRLRDAVQERAEGKAPGRRGVPRAALPATRTRSPRSWRRTTSCTGGGARRSRRRRIRANARLMLVRAGERAASLAADAEAQRSFERAAELTEDTVARRSSTSARADGAMGARGEEPQLCSSRRSRCSTARGRRTPGRASRRGSPS